MMTTTSQILQELRRDHSNVMLLLGMLEVEAGRLASLEEPDYQLMDDIMRYLTSYADTVHHPKEDRIYRQLQAVQPQQAATLSQIAEDHAEIARFGVELRSDIEAIVSEAIVRRDTVARDAQNYVEKLRMHITWEEQEMFSMIEELQSELDQRAVTADGPEWSDPLFGDDVEEDFKRLFASIQRAIN